ncbi:hypothetical protein DFJ74DRAFT_110163 [Hyaloraphidium curvatum]|nr:hypothetical protein DFJ74DRAFT_110163 [Hyaloraphidium curvatum]
MQYVVHDARTSRRQTFPGPDVSGLPSSAALLERMTDGAQALVASRGFPGPGCGARSTAPHPSVPPEAYRDMAMHFVRACDASDCSWLANSFARQLEGRPPNRDAVATIRLFKAYPPPDGADWSEETAKDLVSSGIADVRRIKLEKRVPRPLVMEMEQETIAMWYDEVQTAGAKLFVEVGAKCLECRALPGRGKVTYAGRFPKAGRSPKTGASQTLPRVLARASLPAKCLCRVFLHPCVRVFGTV